MIVAALYRFLHASDETDHRSTLCAEGCNLRASSLLSLAFRRRLSAMDKSERKRSSGGDWLRLLLLCAGDIERNPGPGIDDIPTMPQLIGLQGKDKMLNIAEAIGHHWRVVGITLLNDESGGIVKAIAKEFRGNALDINLDILECWLQGKGIRDRSWRGLLSVLRMHCRALAESVEEALTAEEAEQGPNSLPIYPSPPTSCTILDPESPSLSAPTSTSDTEPLLDTLVGKKEAGVRDSESVEMKCHTKEYPNINFYSMMTPGGRRVDEGVSNPAYEEVLVPTTLQLTSELNGISDKWFEIGLRLNVPSSILNTIRRVNADDKEVCLEKMCNEWLQREVDPSWSDVVEALESRFVTEQRVADVIQMRYCEPSLDEEPITTAPWSHFNYQ